MVDAAPFEGFTPIMLPHRLGSQIPVTPFWDRFGGNLGTEVQKNIAAR